jgi:hypothetical protein
VGDGGEDVMATTRPRVRLVLVVVAALVVLGTTVVGALAVAGRDDDPDEQADAVAIADEVASTTIEVSTTTTTEVLVTTVPETAPPAPPAARPASPATTAPRSAQAAEPAPTLAPAPTPTTIDPVVWQRAYDACMARQKAIFDQQQATLDAEISELTRTIGSIPPSEKPRLDQRQAQIDTNIELAPGFCRNQAQFG